MKTYSPLTNTEARAQGVSRITAWRSRKRGWFCPGYHVREIAIAPVVDGPAILESARIAAATILNRMELTREDLAPFEFSDLVAEAAARLLELSGHESFQSERWRIGVGMNACKGFIRSCIFSVNHHRTAGGRKRTRRHVEEDELPDFDQDAFRESVKAAVTTAFGPESWQKVWDWATSKSREIPPEIAAILDALR